MTIFYRGKYDIDCTDEAYINAIATHNKFISITRLQCAGEDKEIKELQGRDLPNLIEKLKTQGINKISVEYISGGSLALLEVLPKITSKAIDNQLNTVDEEFSDRIQTLEHAHHYDMGIAFSNELFQAALSEQEAIDMLIKTKDKLKIDGAIHLPSIKSIVFNIGHLCYQLVYGPSPKLNDMCPFHLDIDDGIVNKYPESSSALDRQVMRELQKLFILWQSKHYAGNLFPEELSLNKKREITAANSSIVEIGMFASSEPRRTEDKPADEVEYSPAQCRQ